MIVCIQPNFCIFLVKYDQQSFISKDILAVEWSGNQAGAHVDSLYIRPQGWTVITCLINSEKTKTKTKTNVLNILHKN